MNQRRKGQERLIDLFKAEGVESISGIVDVHFMDFHRAAKEAGIAMIGTRHEVASAMVADAVARMTGKPQVCMAAFGPGVANLVGGVVCAKEEHVPMVVVVTGRSARACQTVVNSKYQLWDQVGLFRSITKWATQVRDIRYLDEAVREAFRRATSGTPGPVFLEVSIDAMWSSMEFPIAAPPDSYRSLNAPVVSESCIDAAADMLANARLPVILSGQGVHIARAHAYVEQLARVLQCPVLPTFGGRGVLPENDPQTLIFGTEGANRACREADVVLAVGTSIGEPLLFGQAPRWGDPDKQKWIHIESNADMIHTNRIADIAIVGDMRDALPKISDALESEGPFSAPPQLADYRAAQAQWREKIVELVHEDSPIHPGALMLALRAAMPDETVLVSDGGCTVIWELCLFEKRSRDYLWTSHTGHLGSGLPYALGARIATPKERPVLLITGDGALGFQWMEFETAVRHDLPILVVVNCDQTWGMELMDFYDGPESADRCPGVRMTLTRYDQMAKAVGGHGEFVEKLDELPLAIERSLASGKPALVQVMTDYNANANTAVLPGLAEIFSFYNLDGSSGYGHFEDIS